jgi:phosphoribosyl 1,2-cyclic phosphodiesterase
MGLKYCSLASGSSGNSQLIAFKDTKVLLDAGLSGKYIKNSLESISESPEDIKAVLVTHEHSDHIKGVGVLMRRYDLDLYVNEKTFEAMKTKIGKINLEKVHIIKKGEEFYIGDLRVKSFEISHDAADPVAYSFFGDDSKVTVATDLGEINERIICELEGSDLLVLESNHDVEMLKSGPYPYYLKRRVLSEHGHLSNDIAGSIVAELFKRGGVGNVLLAHLSKENNFPELAYETVKCIVEENGIFVGTDVNLDMTYRDKVSRYYSIKKSK